MKLKLLALPSSSRDLIKLFDKVGSLLSQVAKSIQEALVPIKGISISTMLTNPTHLDVQISLALCPSELIPITAANPPFEDELLKKAFQVIMSSFQDLPDHVTNLFHKRLCTFESMAKARSHVMCYILNVMPLSQTFSTIF